MDKEVEKGKVCAVLSYLLIGIIWYFADEKMKRNSFAKFHAKQGLVLLIAGIVVWVLDVILMFIPILGWLVMVLLEILMLVWFILGLINALNGKKKELPIIGKFAKSFKF